MNYEVRTANHIENTDLDGEVFATREEADLAAAMVRSDYGATKNECDVCETSSAVTTTFADWNAKGW
jgi:hypothetical protein